MTFGSESGPFVIRNANADDRTATNPRSASPSAPTTLNAVITAPDSATPGRRVSVVVMASGTGSLLGSLLDRAAAPATPFDIAAVVTDRECRAEQIAAERGIAHIRCRLGDHPDRECRAEQIAAERGIAHIRCRLGDHPDRAAWDRALTESVAAYAPEWVVTAGFMKILGPEFLARFGGRVVNSHPALLPSFPGAHGVAEALAYGVKVTGATVHLVDDGIDTGPILAQQVVEVEPDDDVDTLHERIKTVERVLLADVVTALVTHGVDIDGRKARIP